MSAGTPTIAATTPDPTAPQDWDSSAQTHQFRTFVDWLSRAVIVVAIVEGLVAAVFQDPYVGLTSLTLVATAAWLRTVRSRIGARPLAQLAQQTAVWMLVLIGANGILQPASADIVTIAALLPIVLVIPFVPRRTLLSLMGLGWAVAIAAMAAAELLPRETAMPPELIALTRIFTMAIVIGLVLLLLWQFSDHLTSSARDLNAIVAMSRALSQTLDVKRVGDLTARHVAEAVAADECGICYWDRGTDQILTYGYHPVERRGAVAEAYPLADYPASRRVLERQEPLVLTADDPTADPSEVAYLRSIGQRSLAMIPLVAKGRSLGILELTAARPWAFADRQLDLAVTLAAEAALAMDNARLYEELRDQAFHDPLTGLANRALFTERIAAALSDRGAAGGADHLAPTVVLYLDLDDFKQVNDDLGHVDGDRLLVSVADRIRTCLRPGDTAARLGGDEFAILLEPLPDIDQALVIGERVRAAIAEPFLLDGTLIRTGCSIGVASARRATTTRSCCSRPPMRRCTAPSGSGRAASSLRGTTHRPIADCRPSASPELSRTRRRRRATLVR